MEYGVIGTSDQSDSKDGLEELCPVCGDKECFLLYTLYSLSGFQSLGMAFSGHPLQLSYFP